MPRGQTATPMQDRSPVELRNIQPSPWSMIPSLRTQRRTKSETPRSRTPAGPQESPPVLMPKLSMKKNYLKNTRSRPKSTTFHSFVKRRISLSKSSQNREGVLWKMHCVMVFNWRHRIRAFWPRPRLHSRGPTPRSWQPKVAQQRWESNSRCRLCRSTLTLQKSQRLVKTIWIACRSKIKLCLSSKSLSMTSK